MPLPSNKGIFEVIQKAKCAVINKMSKFDIINASTNHLELLLICPLSPRRLCEDHNMYNSSEDDNYRVSDESETSMEGCKVVESSSPQSDDQNQELLQVLINIYNIFWSHWDVTLSRGNDAESLIN